MIPILSWTYNNDGSWTLTWENVGASFYRIVLYGKVLNGYVTDTTYTYIAYTISDFPPPIEVAYEGQEVWSELFFPYLIVQFYGEPSATNYIVQQYNGASWTVIARITEVGQWLYTYTTSLLLDETSYSFQVIAFDALGNQSTPRNYSIYVVTPPIPPDGQMQVSYTKPNVIVSAVT